MTDMKTYTITLTERQAWLIQRACDFMSFCYMGRFSGIKEIFLENVRHREQNGREQTAWPVYAAQRDMMGQSLETAEQFFIGQEGPGYGTSSREIHDNARILCDIHEVIRHQLRKDDETKPTSAFCSDYPARHWQKDIPLIIIHRKGDTK